MKASILASAEQELEEAFDYYELQRAGLGLELLNEFRRGPARILEHPEGWPRMNEKFRRYRLHRFPFGIIYKIQSPDELVIHAFMHMSRWPGTWPGAQTDPN